MAGSLLESTAGSVLESAEELGCRARIGLSTGGLDPGVAIVSHRKFRHHCLQVLCSWFSQSSEMIPDHEDMEVRERLQDHLNRLALALPGIPDTANQNRIDLGRPERLVHPAGEP